MGCGASAQKANDVPHFLVLPQKDSAEGKEARKRQLAKARAEYEWELSDWLPPHVKGIPQRELDRDKTKSHFKDLFIDLKGSALKMNLAKPLHLLEQVFDTCAQPFDQWAEIYPAQITKDSIRIPSVAQRWRSDKEFGRQKLNGINPMMVKKYRPWTNFPVTDALLQGVLPPGQTLESMQAANRLYMMDYGFLTGVTGTATDTTWVVPILLFMIDDDKDLVPIAIQLQQQTSETNPIFTPRDDPGTWQLAKWFCQSADGAIHQNVMHLLSTHLLMETVFVAAHRNLAERHPVHELIDAHFWFTILINYSARNSLMVPGGQLPLLYPQGYEGMRQLVGGFGKTWDWNYYNVPEVIKHHGTDNVEHLPKYYFRDDALRLWTLVEDYVRSLMNLAYSNDKDVADDVELQEFAKELQQVGVSWQNLPMTNGKFATKDQLVRFLTTVVFTVSCNHAAVNNGQFDVIGYVPNYPPKLSVPTPKSKSETYTDHQLAKALPGYDASVVQISFFYSVSLPTDPSKRLGQYHNDFMVELPGAMPVIRHFQQQLDKLGDEIRKRNHGLPVPYTYLDPIQIASGVAV